MTCWRMDLFDDSHWLVGCVTGQLVVLVRIWDYAQRSGIGCFSAVFSRAGTIPGMDTR